VDELLQQAIFSQTAAAGRSSVISEYYDRTQILLGNPGSANSLDEQISTFFNDLQALADAPERTSSRAAVVESAINLAREISNIAYRVEELRLQADLELSQGVGHINNTLKELFSINQSIAQADAFGTTKATLLDKRDTAIEKLAEYIDVRPYIRADGQAHIYAGNGVSLLDEVLYQVDYQKLGSLDALIEGDQINPITVRQVDENGRTLGIVNSLATEGTGSDIQTNFFGGKLKGLLEVRDQLLPAMLEQFDMLAYTLRENFNVLHNQGTGYPPASELTGTRAVGAGDRSVWEGEVRIAVLNKDGTVAPAAYNDETSGFRPLTLDLSSLNSGGAIGETDLQTIIDEINNHFGIPQNRFEMGNFNQIQLAMVSDRIPGATPTIEFDFDIENISGTEGQFWVNNVVVLDDSGANIGVVTDTMPSLQLDPVNTYTTIAGSNQVTINTQGAHSLQVGDVVRLFDPGGAAIDGIPTGEFDGYFVIEAVTGNGFTVRMPNTAATAGVVTGRVGQTVEPPYAEVEAGDKTRLFQNGTISADISANTASRYYDVQVSMAVRQPDGTVSTNTVTYRIENPAINTRNDRISARDANPSQSGELHIPNTTQGYIKAILVDENGVELPKINGEYGDQKGYLKLVSLNPEYTIAIDEMNSKQLGLPNDVPPQPGTNRGFSYYFELNNFFESNEPNLTGDAVKNSAINFAVEDRFQRLPSLLSTGNLERSNQSSNPNAAPVYTYERYSGDHSIAQQLAGLGIKAIDFAAAGGLSSTSLTFGDFAGEMIGFISARAISADVKMQNDQSLLTGYGERADAISGVNLDEELANTIIYQNAYTASARVITVTDELFDTLLQAL